mmetsp:Transcript_23844/g.36861  ORF Transcript_23844/g.36861 Transcript_23844/m.36861 type:complete len:501 (-) Transcript_23844:1849-3351(-)
MRDTYTLSRQSTEQSVDQTLVDAFRDIRLRKKGKGFQNKTRHGSKLPKRNAWDEIENSSDSGYNELYERNSDNINKDAMGDKETGSFFDPIQAQRSRSLFSTTTRSTTSQRYVPLSRSQSASNKTWDLNVQRSSSGYINDWSAEAPTAPSVPSAPKRIDSSADAILSCRTRSVSQSRSKSRLDQVSNDVLQNRYDEKGQGERSGKSPIGNKSNSNGSEGIYNSLRSNINQLVDRGIQQDHQEYERRYYNAWGSTIDKSIGQGLNEALQDLQRRKDARKGSHRRMSGRPPMQARDKGDVGSLKQCEYIARAPWRPEGKEYRYEYVQRKSPVCEGVELEKDRSGNIFIFDSKSKSNALYEIIENEDGSIALQRSSMSPDRLVESESFCSGRPCQEIIALSNDGESVSVLSVSSLLTEATPSGVHSAVVDQHPSRTRTKKRQNSFDKDEVVEDDNTESEYNEDRYAPAICLAKTNSRSFRQLKQRLCTLKCFKDQPRDHDAAF